MTGLKIVGATLALLLSMYLYADNAPSVKRGYQATVETGGSVERQYLEDGAYQTSRYTAHAESPIEKYTVYAEMGIALYCCISCSFCRFCFAQTEQRPDPRQIQHPLG